MNDWNYLNLELFSIDMNIKTYKKQTQHKRQRNKTTGMLCDMNMIESFNGHHFSCYAPYRPV